LLFLFFATHFLKPQREGTASPTILTFIHSPLSAQKQFGGDGGGVKRKSTAGSPAFSGLTA
jgi:hypothetical protein